MSIVLKEIIVLACQRTRTKLGKRIIGMAAYVTMDTQDTIVQKEPVLEVMIP